MNFHFKYTFAALGVLGSLVSIGYDYSNGVYFFNSQEELNKIRDHYNTWVTSAYKNNYEPIFRELHKSKECIDTSFIESASRLRNVIKNEIRKENTLLERKFLEIRDWWFFKERSNDEYKAYSSFKTGGGDLGLKNNGFDDILKTFSIIQKGNEELQLDRGIYPEIITLDQAKSFLEGYNKTNENQSLHIENLIAKFEIIGMHVSEEDHSPN